MEVQGHLVCSTVWIIRVGTNLVEAAWIDDTSNPLQHEHHIIMTSVRFPICDNSDSWHHALSDFGRRILLACMVITL
jgi:hypothetical protein